MRRPPPWTALGSVVLAVGFFAGADAQTDGTWLLMGLPSDRDGHSAVYDAARDRMVAFGGMSTTRRNDVWVLPLSSATGWHQMLVVGAPPGWSSNLLNQPAWSELLGSSALFARAAVVSARRARLGSPLRSRARGC
jgi:hypothetical protein